MSDEPKRKDPRRLWTNRGGGWYGSPDILDGHCASAEAYELICAERDSFGEPAPGKGDTLDARGRGKRDGKEDG